MAVPGGRGPQLIAVNATFLALSTITILMRVYCRGAIVKSFGLDDWFAIIAWIFFVLFGAFSIAGVYHGTGQRMGTAPMSEFPVALKWWWTCESVYILSNMALKLSIGIMLLRLTIIRVHRIIIWVVVAITEVFSVVFLFMFIFQCRPSSYFWTRYTNGTGICYDPDIIVDMTYAWSAISCVGDWIFAIVPAMIVWNLQMNVRTKISVVLILSMGAIASAATIVRLPYVHTLKDKDNFLYATLDVAIWSITETGLGIAACSIATLRPLFRAFLSRTRLMGDTSTNKNNDTGGVKPGRSRGYIRSGPLGTDDIGLRSDLGTGQGVVTVIECDPEMNLEMGSRGRNVRRFGSQKGLADRGGSGWRSSSESKRSVESLNGDVDWGNGIRKTTVSNQVVG